IREPNLNIFLQCLNPVEMAVPKCITVKERY
ncbi:transmembrane regulator, partial [Salmonella enterica]|nr:transmembrane regulator [Salmonella enterica]